MVSVACKGLVFELLEMDIMKPASSCEALAG